MWYPRGHEGQRRVSKYRILLANTAYSGRPSGDHLTRQTAGRGASPCLMCETIGIIAEGDSGHCRAHGVGSERVLSPAPSPLRLPNRDLLTQPWAVRPAITPVFQVRKPRHIQGHPANQRTTQIQAQPLVTWLPCWLDLKLALRAWVSAYRGLSTWGHAARRGQGRRP